MARIIYLPAEVHDKPRMATFVYPSTEEHDKHMIAGLVYNNAEDHIEHKASIVNWVGNVQVLSAFYATVVIYRGITLAIFLKAICTFRSVQNEI